MTKDARSGIALENLQEVIDASASSAKQAFNKGQAQYSTPAWFARRMASLLPTARAVVLDHQCGAGALTEAAAEYGTRQIGIEIDNRLRTEGPTAGPAFGPAMPLRITANCVDVWRLWDEFFPRLTLRCQVANPPFGLRWKLPDGKVYDSTEATWWRMLKYAGDAGCGYMIANRATIERLKLQENPKVYLYQTFPSGIFDADVEIGVLHFSGDYADGIVRPYHMEHASTDPDAIERACSAFNTRSLGLWIDGSPVDEVWKAFETIRDLLAEEKRKIPPFNIYLDAYGYLRTYLSLRNSLERKLTKQDVEKLAKINKCSPLTLTTERDTRLLMDELVSAGVYTVQPEAKAAVKDALAQMAAISCPIMPITDFERTAYADENEAVQAIKPAVPHNIVGRMIGTEVGQVDMPLSYEGKSVYIPGAEEGERPITLTPGKRYPITTGSFEFVQRYQRMRLHMEGNETYAAEHDCTLTGQDRYIYFRDDTGQSHRFVDRPDYTRKVAPFEHSDELLWKLFTKPEVQTVADKYPSAVAKNLAVMEAAELLAGFEYFPGQRDFYSRVAVRDYALVGAATGCHLAGTLILMADGTTKKVECITPHDLVMGWDGKAQRVLSTCGGREQMARIVPTKGEPFTVNLSHILTLVRTRRKKGDQRAGEVVDITVRDYLRQPKWYKHIHKLFRKGIELPAQKVPLTPYFMGVYLGDGSSAGDQVEITKPDAEILEAVQFECELQGWTMRTKQKRCNATAVNNLTHVIKGGDVRKVLRSLGLLRIMSGDRFIPDCYKRGNRFQRSEVLAGLLDTDGHLDRCGTFDYISQSKQLAGDVCFVARSLGLAAYMAPCEKHCQTGAGGTYYRVCISGDLSTIPTRIPRKKGTTRCQKKDVLRTGFKVELLDEDWYHGFSLDGDGRFLLGDFTVTHNTGKSLGAITLIALKAPQRALICAPQGTTKGGKEDEDSVSDMQASQWITELRRFAPGLQVFELFSEDDYDRIVAVNEGALPHGVYVTYYEAMFSNNSRESFNPAGKYSDRDMAAFLGVKDPNPEHLNGTRDWCTGIGEEKNGIRCIVTPCLASKIGHLFDFVALDEAHKMCHLSARVTQMIVRLQPRYRYALTATPIPNLVTDIFPIMGWLCVPGWFRGGVRNAAWPYAREDGYRFYTTFLSTERDLTQERMNRDQDPLWRGKCERASPVISAPARLLKIIKPTMAFISKEACNPNKPKVTVHDVRVPMGQQQAKLYGHYMNRANVPGKNAMIKAATQVAILRDLCAAPASSDWNKIDGCRVLSNFNPKTAAILSLVRDILSRGEQVVIVGARLKQTSYLAARLTEAGIPYARIDSSAPPEKHTQQANLFKQRLVPVMFMGIKCAQAHSFDQCPNEIVSSLEYSFGAFDQASGRIDRVTSKRPMHIYCVLHTNSIEEIMFDIVATKGDAATICLRGERVPRNFKTADLGEVVAQNFENFKLTKDQPEEGTIEAEWPQLCKALRAAFVKSAH